jgi:isopenicillin N synthase-like dioxygenase
MTEIPCIDIGAFRAGDPDGRVARAWGRAFEEVGFATIVGHGIPESVIERAYDSVLRFFDLPLAEKLRWDAGQRVKTRGYLPIGIESVARTRGDDRPADLCEALVFYGVNLDIAAGLESTHSAITGNLYPSEPAGLADAIRTYFLAVYRLGGLLMRISARALDLPEGYFEPYFDRRRGTLRAVHYPDQPDEPVPGQLRYGAHSDYGGLTILRQDAAPGGLQVFAKSGEWIDVHPVPGSFVINVGDLMARWTNDRWCSTLHRVVNPPRDATGSTRRLSLVLFTGPNDDAVVSCLPTCTDERRPARYPPVRAADYIQEKLSTSMPKTLAAPAPALSDR